MKSLQLAWLSGCVAVAVAAEEVFAPQSSDVCWLPPPAVSIWNDASYSGNPTFAGNENATRAAGVPATPWTHNSPCFRDDNGEFCVYSSASFAEGRGISIFTNAEKASHLLQKPAFTSPKIEPYVNQDINQTIPHKYKAVPIPGKDMGVVATEPLQLGDHIMSTTVSLMLDYEVFNAVPQQDQLRLQAHAVDVLPPSHRERLLQLSTHSDVDGHLVKVEKILATNAFDVEIDNQEESSFYAVFNEISRHNHDCRPNADYHWDPETLTQHVHAIRPIAAGEEITLSYIDSVQPKEARSARLQRSWGFSCSCSACTQNDHHTAASDARIAQILSLHNALEDYTAGYRGASPQMAELLVSLYAQERLDHVAYEGYGLAAVEWNGVGNPWTATQYARLAVQYGLATVGPANGVVRDMQNLAAHPESHWSWMIRRRRPEGS